MKGRCIYNYIQSAKLTHGFGDHIADRIRQRDITPFYPQTQPIHLRVKRQILTTVPGITVQTWEEVRAPYLRAVNNEKVLLLIVLSFIILLAGFTILATDLGSDDGDENANDDGVRRPHARAIRLRDDARSG